MSRDEELVRDLLACADAMDERTLRDALAAGRPAPMPSAPGSTPGLVRKAAATISRLLAVQARLLSERE